MVQLSVASTTTSTSYVKDKKKQRFSATIMRMITLHNLPLTIKQIHETIVGAGFESHLVGGCVRDVLLGRTPKDWDFTTSATPDQIQALFPESFCNNDYGTVGIKTGEDTPYPDFGIIEVTPYRAESGYTDARRPDTVTFGVTLAEDLARRDFTVNAIAYDLTKNDLVDLFDGLTDLKAKRLRAVGNPDERFAEDALRMMRAVRLAAELEFVIESETMSGIMRNADRLKLVAIERIMVEFVAGFSIMPMMGLVMGGTMVTGLAFVWLLQIVGLFFSSGITHIAVKLLGGKNSYADTYKAIAYGSTPAALLGIIPYVGIVASVYSLYIDIKGVSALQKMSAARSAIAVLILPLLVLLLAVFVASKLTGTGMF